MSHYASGGSDGRIGDIGRDDEEYSGKFLPPTEAGSMGAFVVILSCIFTRDLTLKGIITSIEEPLRTTCMVRLIIASSAVLGHFVAIANIPLVAADWLTGLPLPMTVFIVKDVTGSAIGLIYSGAYPFLISMIRCVILLFLFPGLVTYLPSVMMK